MRILKILSAILMVILLAAGTAGCNRNAAPASTAATTRATATIGTISNAVTGSATLGLAKIKDLTFEMAGIVESILVEESETVKEGQVLATLDPSDWEEKIKTLENNLSTAKRNLESRKLALTKSRRVIDSKELSLKQAELNLKTAQADLENIEEVKTAQASVDALKNDIAYAESARRSAQSIGDKALAKTWTEQIGYLNEDLAAAERRRARVLSGAGVKSDDVALQIEKAVFAVEQAEKAVRDARIAIEDAQVDVDDAQLNVNDSQDDVDLAQSKLDDEKALNPKVVAPFDGFITSIKASGGDEVFKGSVAMQIADADQFEASFMVSESDIFSVKTGQPAVVTVDAINNAAFPAKVTAIAPLATVNSGVVNYKVTAEITSLVPVANPAFSMGAFPSGGFPAGGFPGGGAISGGFPSGAAPGGSEGGFASGERPTGFPGKDTGAGEGEFPAMTGAKPAADSQPVSLKQGLSATVTITIQEKKNVLIVPLRSLTRNSGKTTVQVVEGENTNTVEVVTGLSDDSNIEIVSGLTEGQTVIVKASGTSNNMFGPGMMMMR